MWTIPTGTSSALKKKKQVKSPQYMVSRPELGSDPPIRSDRESGCDIYTQIIHFDARAIFMAMHLKSIFPNHICSFLENLFNQQSQNLK